MKRLVVRLLPFLITLVSGAPVHAADSALVAAVKKSDRSGVQRLLQQGAAVNVAGTDGSTALLWAVELDDPEMTRL